MPFVKMKTFLDAGHSVDVDIFLNQTRFQNSVMNRRQAFDFDGRSLAFVTAEDRILFRLLANRPRGLGDVADVLFVQGKLDETYMRAWAEPLGILERLNVALAEEGK